MKIRSEYILETAIMALAIIFFIISGSSLRNRADSFFSVPNSSLSSIQLENEMLKARLEQLKNQPERIKIDSKNFLAAHVYLNYPFNQKNLILIDAGKNLGITQNMPVMANGRLIGYIDKPYETTSLVKTFLDHSVSLKVFIVGAAGNRSPALLNGGPTPLITLADKAIVPGDKIINADERLPFGWSIGVVQEKIDEPANAFANARVDVGGTIATTSTVLVYIDEQHSAATR